MVGATSHSAISRARLNLAGLCSRQLFFLYKVSLGWDQVLYQDERVQEQVFLVLAEIGEGHVEDPGCQGKVFLEGFYRKCVSVLEKKGGGRKRGTSAISQVNPTTIGWGSLFKAEDFK